MVLNRSDHPVHASTTCYPASIARSWGTAPSTNLSGVSATMADTRCPLCGQGSQRLFQKQGLWLRGCGSCGHRFAEVTTTVTHADDLFSDAYFAGEPGGYRNYLGQGKQLRRQGRRYGMLLARYTPPGRVLAVGAAGGFLLKGLADVGWDPAGIEPNASMVKHGQRVLGLPLQRHTLETLTTPTVTDELTGTYDLVTFIQVWSHLSDLNRALTTASRLTKPRGYWLVEIRDRTSHTARLQGKHWSAYSPPTTLQWFSPNGVIQLARQHGFRPIAQGIPQKWTSTGQIKQHLRNRLPKVLWPSVRLIPSGWPIPCWSEGMRWILLQKLPQRHNPNGT